MKRLSFLLILLLIISTSCKKDEPAVDVTPAMARDSLYFIMKQWYYWYDLMPVVTREDYNDPYELMEAMRYKTLDRWSFVIDYDEYMEQVQGTFTGHGISIGIDDASKARISMIYRNSPLYAEGVRRVWIIKSINGTDIAPLIIAGDFAAYNIIIGPASEGVRNTFVFQKPDGTETTIASTKSKFTLNTVILYDTLHLSTGLTGHIVLESFIIPTENELKLAFAFFRENGVKELVLDLRYNPGGYLDVAQTLASYIAGNGLAGTTFARLQYNSKNQAANSSFPFIATSFPMSLQKVIVITTHNTASASEAVMNGLKGFVDVISIGDTTEGKPTGMNGWAVAEKIFLLAGYLQNCERK
jgi:C-terminal processing protease CtpA/Prc